LGPDFLEKECASRKKRGKSPQQEEVRRDIRKEQFSFNKQGRETEEFTRRQQGLPGSSKGPTPKGRKVELTSEEKLRAQIARHHLKTRGGGSKGVHLRTFSREGKGPTER